MFSRSRNSLVSWLVVGPFAIVLAFPFYWMLMTSLKTNGDLYDVKHDPFVFNAARAAPNEHQPLKGHDWLPLGIENVTTQNYNFIFHEPGIHYVRWLEDAALIDGASRLKALVRVVFPISLPGILTVVIFSFSLCVNEFIYAVTFISTSDARTVSTGVPLELIRGDVYFWQSLMAATLIPGIPLALLYNTFLDRFIAGFTGGAFR